MGVLLLTVNQRGCAYLFALLTIACIFSPPRRALLSQKPWHSAKQFHTQGDSYEKAEFPNTYAGSDFLQS